ncbi:hypothetical protein N5094_12275 [Shewanella putrefaciens]|jgi:hypothetical protein|nr:hypothetical protein [Shewanella putrefaciens]UXK07185.1 hypothetical protein N5094_12275 [Shewanella putrefaciens]
MMKQVVGSYKAEHWANMLLNVALASAIYLWAGFIAEVDSAKRLGSLSND